MIDVNALNDACIPIRGARGDYDALVARAGTARYVLLGEATHGTHEFYAARAYITRRLIVEKGFSAIAVEADWPAAYRVNRFVRGEGSDRSAVDALGSFTRFPRWMWRNTDVLSLVGWLREHNDELPPQRRVGFYGLDLYSLHASMAAVLDYLRRVDPRAEERARRRYACFDEFGDDPQRYGYLAALGLGAACEKQVLDNLLELSSRAWGHLERDGLAAEDAHFSAEQNARLVKNAERYYRQMFLDDELTWNLRDRHMVETLEALSAHLGDRFAQPKVVVWAHNSHLGDARATSMAERGELNVGQLVREAHGSAALLVGLSTYEGTVTAASNWGGRTERKRLRPARPDSVEGLLHAAALANFYLDTAHVPDSAGLEGPRLERAVGVVYRPESELASHYFRARATQQFDAILHFDRTAALEPLDRTSAWERGEAVGQRD